MDYIKLGISEGSGLLQGGKTLQPENAPNGYFVLYYYSANGLEVSGFYAGTWASNVDFGAGEDTNIEWDVYLGQHCQLNDRIGIDLGIAYT
jgi:uncharacterized protein (TIGR02001 family)